MPDRKLSAMDSVTSPNGATDSLVGYRSSAKGIRVLLSDLLAWINTNVAPAWSSVTGKPSTFAPSSHTHTATDISDSTSAGRAVLTAADQAAQRSALGLGNSATRAVGTGSGDVSAGNHGHSTLTMTSIVLVCEEDSSQHTFKVLKEGSNYIFSEV